MDVGRVLLVDDSPVILEVLADGLTQEGWEVESAQDGQTAVEMATLLAFDVVVCDLNMPGMDGLEVMRALSKIDPQLPVIVLSAEEHLSRVIEVVHQGAFDYVQKLGSDLSPLLASV